MTSIYEITNEKHAPNIDGNRVEMTTKQVEIRINIYDGTQSISYIVHMYQSIGTVVYSIH